MVSRCKIGCSEPHSADERGYALPSVLLLVTLLMTVALSVIAMQYLRRKEVLHEVHLLKSDLAARNGIARTLACVSSDPALLESWERLYFSEVFPDSTRSHTELIPLGMFIALRSRGFSAKIRTERTLLAANRLTSGYASALTLHNLNHQLVMTGSAMIRGDVSLGPSGATTGTLRDHSTPLTLPVIGKIHSAHSASTPQYRSAWIEAMARGFQGDFAESGATDQGRVSWELAPEAASHLLLKEEDSIEVIRVSGPLRFSGVIRRTWPPLVIVVRGGVEILPGATLDGLVEMAASDTIVIKAGSRIKDAILVSGRGIRVEPYAELCAQLFAPDVTVEEGAMLRYPSAAVALDTEPGELKPLGLEVRSSASIEGFAAVFHTGGRSHPESRGVFSPRSRMVGLIYATSRVTLDGDVAGSVVAGDLYFYVAPTHYYGWMREGLIDRSRLPEHFLVPPAVAERTELEILKWIRG